MTQKEILSLFIPILKQDGKIYKKTKRVFAKVAKGGEEISTETSDGIETHNVAKKGDFIIENQTESKEQYIIEQHLFDQRYVLLGDQVDGFSEYRAIGKIRAVCLDSQLLKTIGLKDKCSFMAKWGSEVTAKENDFVVCPPDYSEIYRIARKEFFETYQLDEQGEEEE